MTNEADSLGNALAERRAEVLAACACTNLRKASRVITRRFDRALEPSGLRATQFSLLLACAGPGPVSILELAESLAVDRTTLTRTLRPLARDGLISITPGADRRERSITMTETGHGALTRALPLWAAAEREVTETLGWEDYASLLAGLGKVLALAGKPAHSPRRPDVMEPPRHASSNGEMTSSPTDPQDPD